MLAIVETFFSRLLEKLLRRELNERVTGKDSKIGILLVKSFYFDLEPRMSITFLIDTTGILKYCPKRDFLRRKLLREKY